MKRRPDGYCTYASFSRRDSSIKTRYFLQNSSAFRISIDKQPSIKTPCCEQGYSSKWVILRPRAWRSADENRGNNQRTTAAHSRLPLLRTVVNNSTSTDIRLWKSALLSLRSKQTTQEEALYSAKRNKWSSSHSENDLSTRNMLR